MPRQVDLDMIELIDNKLTVDEYLKLRALVGWKKLSREQAQKALDNSLLVVGAYLAGQPIGMGRLVGDGAVICYVQDLVIPPQAQGYGIGSLMLSFALRKGNGLLFIRRNCWRKGLKPHVLLPI